MNRSARPYRAFPPAVHRRPPPDANVVRRHWRDLAAAALGLARSAMVSEGRERAEALELRHDLSRAPAFPLPASDAGAACVVRCFRDMALSVLNAGTDERRALLSPALAELARAIDGLLDEEIAPYVAHARRITGEPEKD